MYTKTTKGRSIFLSGGTGYVGSALAKRLLSRGHQVQVLARTGSESKVPTGAIAVRGDALNSVTFAHALRPNATLIHLIGIAHPAPWKGQQFRKIDLVSLRASAEAAQTAGIAHFIYVSVAHPAPVMAAYIQVRRECEEILAATGLRRTVLRPWYILGPGHRWPIVLKPIYAALRAFPPTRPGAERLGLVTLEEMTSALVWAVENPPEDLRIMDVAKIREVGG